MQNMIYFSEAQKRGLMISELATAEVCCISSEQRPSASNPSDDDCLYNKRPSCCQTSK